MELTLEKDDKQANKYQTWSCQVAMNATKRTSQRKTDGDYREVVVGSPESLHERVTLTLASGRHEGVCQGGQGMCEGPARVRG